VRSYARTSSPIGLLTLSMGFLLLVALLVVFSRQLVQNISDLTVPAMVIAVFAVLVLPLILLGFIIYQTVRLLGDRARRRPGSLLKGRFILFITALVLLATIPLELVSFNFIDLASSFWLSAGIEESIGGATRLALDYYDTTVKNLETFTGSGLFGSFLAAVRRNPAAEWRTIIEANASIDFIQVFDGGGVEVAFLVADPHTGARADLRVASLEELRRQPALGRVDRRSLSFIRARVARSVGGVAYEAAVGTVLSPGFSQGSSRLSAATDRLAELNLYSRNLGIAVLLVYVLFTLPILLLCLLAGFYLADELVLPIMSLEDAIRRVAQGDFSFRILTRSRDELSVLVNSFNRMVTELADSRQKLRQAEKIAAWKEIARRLAHELKNPLTPIKLSAQRILRRLSTATGAEELGRAVSSSAESIIREVDVLDGLLREFGDFARLPEPTRAPLKLAEVVGRAVSAYAPAAPAVVFDLEGTPPDLVIPADAAQLGRVFSNLFRNAIHAMPSGGTVTILADVVRKGESDYCRILVRDTGVGMDEETRRQAFLPYFTTKKEGTGLGLAIVERIVFDHNGQIWLESHTGAGTTVFMDLPMV
jgi:two-component system, NtrC family, nitrogen regulation sensor histidine kinase NtrY